MSRDARQKLLGELQLARGGKLCIVYVTSTRTGLEIQIADDVIRLLYDHLEAGSKIAREKGIDLFIHSNGGSSTVPWRLVNLIREYTKNFSVLVPHRAFSAATLIALGADELVMHPMGNLGPIDPSVTNGFNPVLPQAPGQLAPISVEDVSAYFKLIKDEVGIRHEDELIAAVSAMTEKVHPLALGNVQRSHNQSRMMARKLLKMRSSNTLDHEIEQLIETLKSNLFFHGHPISRHEAREDLKLPIVDPTPEAESLMWKLYREYESTMKMDEPFQPLRELEKAKKVGAPTVPPTTQQVVQQMKELAAQGITLGGGITEDQFAKLAAAMLPIVTGAAPGQVAKSAVPGLEGAYVESLGTTDVFKTDMLLYREIMNTSAGPQDVVKTEVSWQRWERQS
jgi:hypothetical protein